MSIDRSRPGRRAVTILGTLAILVAAPTPGEAQHPQVTVSPDSLRRIQSVEPRSGPPGTTIRIYSENLPLQARIIVGVGAMNSGLGFEEVGVARQQEFGEVSATVRLPQSAPWDRPVYIILFNGIFSPVGLSEPFHVTRPDGTLQRTGAIAEVTPTCATLRDEDEVLYALSGNVGRVRAGEEVVVQGRYSETASCGQAHTIEVVSIERRGS